MVGPHMPWPMMNTALSLPKAPSSCCQITRSIGVAPRPPYSFGQCRQAQPASAFFFCQALPTSTISSFCSLMRPREDFESSASNSFGALASIHLRASARNAASCGVSSKFMAAYLSLSFRGARETREPGISINNYWIPGSQHSAAPRNDESLSPSPRRYLVERNILVDPDIAGQPEHALGDDVAHDLVGTAFDARSRRAQQHRLEFSGGFRILRSAQHAGRALQVERVGCDILNHRTRHQLANRILRPRTLALRQRRDRAHAGVFQPARLHRPAGTFRPHAAIVDRCGMFQHQLVE